MRGLAAKGWKQATLSQVADVRSGLTKGRQLRGPTVDVPYLRVANVQAGRLELSDLRTIAAAPDEVELCRLQIGDVVLTEGGDPDKLGRGAIWAGAVELCLHQNQIFRVRCDPAVLLPAYFSAYLLGQPARGYFLRAAKQTTGIASINKTQLSALPLSLPPLAEQRRIAAILDEADALRRKRRDALTLLDDLLRAAFLEMFGDPVTNPSGWDTPALGDVCEITTGNTPPRDDACLYGDHLEWIKSDNINPRYHYLTPAKEHLSRIGVAVGRTAGPGATLMTCIAGSADCIGNVAMANRLVAFNQQINALAPGQRLLPEYLYCVLLFGKKLVQAEATDSMKGMVSKGRLAMVRVPVPPRAKQIVWREYFASQHAHAEVANGQGATAEAFFFSLLHRAFTGEL